MKTKAILLLLVLIVGITSYANVYAIDEENTGIQEDDGYIDDGQDYVGSQDDNNNDNGNDDEQDQSSNDDNDECNPPDCYPMADDDGNDNDNTKSNDNDNNDNDKSSDNHDDKKSKNDPCNYDGLNVCDKNGDCDNEHYDCVSYDKDGNECTTGQCSGDDDKVCWKNQEFIGCPSDKDNNSDKKPKPNKYGDNHCDISYPDVCIESPLPYLNCDDIKLKNFKVIGNDPHGFDHDNDGKGCESGSGSDSSPNNSNDNPKSNSNNNDNDNSNDNTKSSSSSSSVKKFTVNVVLDNTTEAEALQFQMRVIVYGPHALNKPTLDKPGQIVNISGCISSCYTTFGFTASKVPIGSEISTCVWNYNTGHQSCGYGLSHSIYGPEVIHVSLPLKK